MMSTRILRLAMAAVVALGVLGAANAGVITSTAAEGPGTESPCPPNCLKPVAKFALER